MSISTGWATARVDSWRRRRFFLDPAFRIGFKDMAPVAVGVVPFGMAIGATAVATRVDDFAAWLGGPLIAAGAAHLTVVTLLDAGTAAATVILAGLVVNARFAAYSAALSKRFIDQPTWFRIVGAYVLVDQTFALAANRPVDESLDFFRRYLITISGVLLGVWIVAISTGMALGPVVPDTWELWFTLPLMMTALTAASLTHKRALVAACTASFFAVVLAGLPAGTGLVAAISMGAVAGHLAGRTSWTS